jgi:DNA-binding transcriptional MerR regulator
MTAQPSYPWTLDELTARVALALADDYDGAPNGRVRDVPDPRTIRYYTTIGLLDRPGELRGRTAFYGRRHLLQLVAIKRLQAQGLTLHQVQERLLGLTDGDLERIARLPPTASALPAPDPVPSQAPAARDRAFWKTTPAPAADPTPLLPQGLPLSDDVLLLLTPARPADEADLQALRAAAAPLLKLLAQRRLIRTPHERKDV